MGGQVLHLYNSSRASMVKRLTAYLPIYEMRSGAKSSKRSYGGDHGMQERAPSTEEVFKMVAEEKEHQQKHHHGFASQTLEKAEDAAGEATNSNSSFESVKESFKETNSDSGKENFHKTGDDVPKESVPRHI